MRGYVIGGIVGLYLLSYLASLFLGASPVTGTPITLIVPIVGFGLGAYAGGRVIPGILRQRHRNE